VPEDAAGTTLPGPEAMMAKILAVPLDNSGVAPREISPRLRTQLVYFMSPAGDPGVPKLGEGEYWFKLDNVARWHEEGVFYLVSPLDVDNKTEVEITEEQEDFLAWLKDRGVQHVRVQE
jgi:hypothetical protein